MFKVLTGVANNLGDSAVLATDSIGKVLKVSNEYCKENFTENAIRYAFNDMPKSKKKEFKKLKKEKKNIKADEIIKIQEIDNLKMKKKSLKLAAKFAERKAKLEAELPKEEGAQPEQTETQS
jgi:hypothetical protein